MQRASTLLLLLAVFSWLFAQPEIEPNNSFGTANPMTEGVLATGNIGSPGDVNDYFGTVLNDDGTVRITFSFSGGLPSSNFYVYVYHRGKSLIGSRLIYNSPAGSDSVVLHCRQQDSIYLRISSAGAYSYQLSFSRPFISPNDPEPNDQFAQAQPFSPQDTMKGRIGYAGISSDANDYFFSVLPFDGTLKYAVEYNNTSGTTSSDFFTYIYNKGRSLLSSSLKYNLPLGITRDSIVIHCRAADTMFFRISSNGCFGYRFWYEVIPAGPPDLEPNGTFAEARFFPPTDSVYGRIGYASLSADANDYFFSVLPFDGTLKYVVEYNNTSGTTSSDFFSYIYHKGRTLLSSSFKYNQPLGITRDSIVIHCRAADTMFFRISSTGCFSYRFKYEVIPAGPPDLEPNGTFAEARFFPPTDSVYGRIGYASLSADANDYFFSVLPEDGTLRYVVDYDNTSGATSSDFFTYIYNKGRTLLSSSFKYNQPFGITRDSIVIHGRAADTMFFRISSTGCFSYRFGYELEPSGPADPEPNNTFAEAVLFQPADTVFGRIGFRSVATDGNDYFRSALPEEGTLRIFLEYENQSGSTGSDFFFYLYNSNRSLIGSQLRYNRPLGLSRDTLVLTCRGADTLFFRISSNGAFSYQFRYEVEGYGEADAEPNNTVATANAFALSEGIHGRVGYTGTTRDTDDYFKFFNERRRTIRAFIKGHQTSGAANANFTITIGRLTGSVLFNRILSNLSPGEWEETLDLACLPQDSLYIRLRTNQCMAYEMAFELVEEDPIVTFATVRTGNRFAFVPEMQFADRFEWNLGGNDRTSRLYPTKDYLAGRHIVTLTATDTTCGFVQVARDTFDVRGIESYTPNRAGKGGDVIMNIYGAGFDSRAQARLRQGTKVIDPLRIEVGSPIHMAAVFDLHLVESGQYDVEILLPGEPPFVYANGFEILPFIYPRGDAEIIGPPRIRPNRDVNYQLVVQNTGNVMASGVPVWLCIPDGIDITLVQKEDFTDRLKTLSYYDEDLNQTFVVEESEWREVFDSIRIRYVNMDTLAGEPFRGKAYSLLIPYILPGSSAIVRFKARASREVNASFAVIVQEINFWGSNITPQMMDVMDVASGLFVDNALDALDNFGAKTGNVPLQAFTATTKIGKDHLGLFGKFLGYYSVSGVSAGEAFSQAYGGGALEKANLSAMRTAAEIGGTKAVGAMKFKSGQTQAKFKQDMRTKSQRMLKEKNPGLQKLDQQDLLRMWDKNVSRQDREALLEDLFNLTKAASKIEGDASKMKATIDAALKKCPELKEQLKEFEENHPDFLGNKKRKKKPIEAITSFDPNEIYGPNGVGEARYFRRQGQLFYSIAFENVDTAKAPAQIVRIVNPIDTNRFDLSTVQFHHAIVGDSTVPFFEGRNQFIITLDMPERGLQLQMFAWADHAKGTLNWLFLSIDPITGELVEDPDAGFLPPNVTGPEGEGRVSYSIFHRPEIANNDSLLNSAAIYFDDNAPIFTNTWLNVIDEAAPVTVMNPARMLDGSRFVISWNATDGESGVAYTEVFVSFNGGDFVKLGASFTDQDTLIGMPGDVYEFFAVSTDATGNVEQKAAQAETSITIPGLTSTDPFILYPNPTARTATIRSMDAQGATTLDVIDLAGRRIYSAQQADWNGRPWSFDLEGIMPGLYLVRLVSDRHPKGEVLKLVYQP